MIADKDTEFYNKYDKKNNISVKILEPIVFTPVPIEPLNKPKLLEFISPIMFGIYQAKLKKDEFSNLINNIGLTEGLDRDLILSGALKPYIASENYSKQASNLNIVIHNILVKLNIMVNFGNFARLPLWFQSFYEKIDSASIPILKSLKYDVHYYPIRMTLINSPMLLPFLKNYFVELIIFIVNQTKELDIVAEFICKNVVDNEINMFALSANKEAAAQIAVSGYEIDPNAFDADAVSPMDEIIDDYGVIDFDYDESINM
jgi:hypothetical protein